MLTVQRRFWPCALALVIGTIAVMWARSSAVPVPHAELAAIRAGDYVECTSAQTMSLTVCTECQYNGNGGYVECDDAAKSTACVSYTSMTQCIECEDGDAQCPGMISSYFDEECLDLNQQDYGDCLRTYALAAEQACYDHPDHCP
ncbi:MAG TPA: hypothetical protein VMV69_27105 [Pirellulales bacterium]|nr:hypothetical protein [Pirellulales bacterium]